jgi:hypothetical protein
MESLKLTFACKQLDISTTNWTPRSTVAEHTAVYPRAIMRSARAGSLYDELAEQTAPARASGGSRRARQPSSAVTARRTKHGPRRHSSSGRLHCGASECCARRGRGHRASAPSDQTDADHVCGTCSAAATSAARPQHEAEGQRRPAKLRRAAPGIAHRTSQQPAMADHAWFTAARQPDRQPGDPDGSDFIKCLGWAGFFLIRT